MRICLISERLAPPFDEGFKNVALHLIRQLSARHEVLALTCFGADVPEEGIANIPANRLLLSAPLWRALRGFRPELIYYLPTASTTPASFARARVLRLLGGEARVILLALQPRRLAKLGKRIVQTLAPDLLLSASPSIPRLLPPLPCPVAMIPLGVDLERFAPAKEGRKAALRAQQGIPQDAWVLLHVGHIKEERNVQLLAQAQSQTGCQAVLVGSTSTLQEEHLAAELRNAGVMVISQYIEITRAYQMADGYIFPVRQKEAAIGIPLSVLEAMACNLPLVTTPFGGLPGMFQHQPERGIIFAESDDALLAGVAALRSLPTSETRALVSPYTWEAVAQGMVALTLAKLGGAP